jgi:hypothetical protein
MEVKDTYPDGFFELFGAIDDDTFVEPIEIVKDNPRRLSWGN